MLTLNGSHNVIQPSHRLQHYIKLLEVLLTAKEYNSLRFLLMDVAVITYVEFLIKQIHIGIV